MKMMVSQNYSDKKEKLFEIIQSYYSIGQYIYEGNRNSLKIVDFENQVICIKAFKKPHLINKFLYAYVRKSKAKRSFEYAERLLSKGIGTPEPIAYVENTDWLGLNDSYYICEYIKANYTFRDILKLEDAQKKEKIIRQFVAFTYKLHCAHVEFIDHSTGNTLIKEEGNDIFSFFLVDLNRTNFDKEMNLDERIKNFSKLTSSQEIVALMSNEYAKLTGEQETYVFEKMWKFTADFQSRFYRKKRLKKKLKFWK
ncbi:lipopolysaccharide kinase InaA family protein [Flavobacterium filum]|uniref:lipopolysaccharide kinase InaA family protein n=1 Tax=Flavobacterium TaxID=237 RepID=UPI0004186C0E|nr:lipopolysaccharide kinase InaA family protein [Flavobacterium filum]